MRVHAYDAFISYSHAKDRSIAAALQKVMQTLGKAWWQRRSLRIFRDETSLTATPELWPTIEAALTSSRFLLLRPLRRRPTGVGRQGSYDLACAPGA